MIDRFPFCLLLIDSIHAEILSAYLAEIGVDLYRFGGRAVKEAPDTARTDGEGFYISRSQDIGKPDGCPRRKTRKGRLKRKLLCFRIIDRFDKAVGVVQAQVSHRGRLYHLFHVLRPPGMLKAAQVIIGAVGLFVRGNDIDRELPVIVNAVFFVVAVVGALVQKEQEDGVFIPKKPFYPVGGLLILLVPQAVAQRVCHPEPIGHRGDELRHRRHPVGIIGSRRISRDNQNMGHQQCRQAQRKKPAQPDPLLTGP